MKKVFSLLAVALMAATASAQIVSSNSRNEINEPGEYPAGWNSITLEYNNWGANVPGGMNYFVETKGFPTSLNGISLGYKKAFKVVKELPLYLETGLDAQVALGSNTKLEDHYFDYDGYLHKVATEEKRKIFVLSAKLPVSVMYHWTLPNRNIAIEPLVGLNLKVLAHGKITEDYYVNREKKISNTYDVFNKKDMASLLGDKYGTSNRCLFGFHLGVNAVIKEKYSLGIRYDKDFTNFHSAGLKFHCLNVALGYRF